MDLTSEVVNITKIKDGYFLGDEATASNLDVIIQFKITHMINAAGSQIINAWESIGIKYLTLNWSENSNQNLFDQKDEIANRIVNFIDDAFKNGEGLLVHSLRGQNRGCVVVIIYLIKKFRWTLAKSLEFLTNKKFDVEIPKYFLNQLSFFESRLSKLGQGPKSTTWHDKNDDADPEELLIRNTYVNGLAAKSDKTDMKNFNSFTGKKIVWADNNNYNNKGLLCSTNFGRELVYQKDIKPVLSHKKLKPTKSCLKSRSNSVEIKKSNQLFQSKISENINIGLGTNLSSKDLTNNINLKNQIGHERDNLKLSSVNYPDSLISKNIGLSSTNSNLNSNDLLSKYTNIGNLSSSINTNLNSNYINESKDYSIGSNYQPMSKSLNFENSVKGKENLNSNNINSSNLGSNFSHINISSNSHNPISNTSVNNNNNNIKSIQPSRDSNSNSNTGSNSRPNNFMTNQNGPQVRSYSSGNDPSKNNSSLSNNTNTSSNTGDAKIIIASKYKNVVHNSYNNIFIQSTEDLEKIYNNNNSGSNSNNNFDSNNRIDKYSGLKKDTSSNSSTYIPSINNPYNTSNNNSMNYNPIKNSNLSGYGSNTSSNNYTPGINTNSSNIQIQQSGKITKSNENQRAMMQNNYFSNTSNNNLGGNSSQNSSNVLDYSNKMKVIDYTPSTGSKNINSQGMNYNNYQQTYNSQSRPQNSSSSSNNTMMKQQGFINNYQPELLNKKNNNNFNTNSSIGSGSNTGLLNRPNSQANKSGPIKIQNEYEKKPSTPDNIYNNNISTVKLNSSSKNMNPPQFGTIKRSNSSSKKSDPNERPSTAPQKENERQNNISSQNSLKRLPSPNIKSGSSGLGSSQKNMNSNLSIGNTINMSKYRSPSPSTINKSSTITIGSLKSVGGKPKWK